MSKAGVDAYNQIKRIETLLDATSYVGDDTVDRVEQLIKRNEQLLDEIRWYGKTLGGGVPMIGSAIPARRAVEHWYVVTLPLLYELKAVHGPADRTGCTKCHGQGVFRVKVMHKM